ncbi:hypothetical protein [Nocardiopsis dassonvillei]|uniref:hypothetical protein n=1 Tax=Nocardiopsis dassonvillei TaxID=2014 RepID=UPI0033F3C8D1
MDLSMISTALEAAAALPDGGQWSSDPTIVGEAPTWHLADGEDPGGSGGGGGSDDGIDGPGGEFPDFNSPAIAPPGLEGIANMWIGWGYYAAGFCGFFGLLGAGIWVMIGKFASRSGMAADGLRHSMSVIMGICIVLLAASIVTGMLT